MSHLSPYVLFDSLLNKRMNNITNVSPIGIAIVNVNSSRNLKVIPILLLDPILNVCPNEIMLLSWINTV